MGGVRLQGMCHYSCGILLPKWIAFLAVVGHGHDIFSALLYSHGIPDEFTGRGPGKVTDVVGFEYPGVLAGGFFLFQGFCFCLRTDDNWGIVGLLGLIPTL